MDDKGKKVLILGNGFDLAHKLPTRYTDFLEFCKRVGRIYTCATGILKDREFKTNQLDNWEINQAIKDQILEAFKERKLKSYTHRDGTSGEYYKSNNTLIQEIHECLMCNVWYNYIMSIYESKNIKGENWIDFESEISLVIQYIDRHAPNLSYSYTILQEVFESNRDNEDDDSKKLIQFQKKLTEQDYDKNYEYVKMDYGLNTIKDLREKCFEDLERLIRALELYLAGFVEKLPVNIISDDIDRIKPDYVINFNYTNTYERLYGGKNPVFYIHGKCKENRVIEDNNMVLGIDEYWSEQERDEHTNFSVYKKFVQRIRKKTGIDNYKYLNEIQKIYEKSGGRWSGNVDINTTHTDGTSLVYVFGHSLDITDKDILVDFFDNEAIAVTVFCYNKGTEGELISKTIKIIGEKKLLQKVNQAPSKMEFIIQEDMRKALSI